MNTARHRRHAAFEPEAKLSIPSGGVLIQGAGATFPAMPYQRWFSAYQQQHPRTANSDEPVGSGEEVRRFIGKGVGVEDHFGASDAAMQDEQMAPVPGGAIRPSEPFSAFANDYPTGASLAHCTVKHLVLPQVLREMQDHRSAPGELFKPVEGSVPAYLLRLRSGGINALVPLIRTTFHPVSPERSPTTGKSS